MPALLGELLQDALCLGHRLLHLLCHFLHLSPLENSLAALPNIATSLSQSPITMSLPICFRQKLLSSI